MKIGFDIHGVIDSNPNYFAKLIGELREQGHEIHIITGTPLVDICDDLYGWGIVFDKYFSIAEWCLINSDTFNVDDNGDVWDEPKVWDSAKALYCDRVGVDIHIDDSDVYKKYFRNLRTRCFQFTGENRIEMRQEIASVGECDHYPCTKNCPQYNIYRDKVKKSILGSELSRASYACIVDDPNGYSRDECKEQHELMVSQLVDAIFEELG